MEFFGFRLSRIVVAIVVINILYVMVFFSIRMIIEANVNKTETEVADLLEHNVIGQNNQISFGLSKENIFAIKTERFGVGVLHYTLYDEAGIWLDGNTSRHDKGGWVEKTLKIKHCERPIYNTNNNLIGTIRVSAYKTDILGDLGIAWLVLFTISTIAIVGIWRFMKVLLFVSVKDVVDDIIGEEIADGIADIMGEETDADDTELMDQKGGKN